MFQFETSTYILSCIFTRNGQDGIGLRLTNEKCRVIFFYWSETIDDQLGESSKRNVTSSQATRRNCNICQNILIKTKFPWKIAPPQNILLMGWNSQLSKLHDLCINHRSLFTKYRIAKHSAKWQILKQINQRAEVK